MKGSATEATKAAQPGSADSAVPEPGSWPNVPAQALEMLAQSGAGMVTGAAEIAEEIMTFSQRQLEANLDAWRTLSACHTPGDLLACQREIAGKAAADYFDEARKLTSRMIGVMSDAFVGQGSADAKRAAK